MNLSLRMHTLIPFILVVVLTAISPGFAQSGDSDKSTAVLQEYLDAITTNYIELKDAFVNNNSGQAAKEASEFWVYLEEMNNNIADAAVKRAWVSAKLALMGKLEKLSNSRADIQQQRMLFKEISSMMESLLKEYGPAEQTLYKQYCPMALDGEGAAWLNEKKEILNPYGGQKMLHCGNIVDTIES